MATKVLRDGLVLYFEGVEDLGKTAAPWGPVNEVVDGRGEGHQIESAMDPTVVHSGGGVVVILVGIHIKNDVCEVPISAHHGAK